MELSEAARVGIRRASRELPSLVEQARLSWALISRRGRRRARIISTAVYERLQERERPEERLRAVRGQGIRVFSWTTLKTLKVMTRLGATS